VTSSRWWRLVVLQALYVTERRWSESTGLQEQPTETHTLSQLMVNISTLPLYNVDKSYLRRIITRWAGSAWRVNKPPEETRHDRARELNAIKHNKTRQTSAINAIIRAARAVCVLHGSSWGFGVCVTLTEVCVPYNTGVTLVTSKRVWAFTFTLREFSVDLSAVPLCGRENTGL